MSVESDEQNKAGDAKHRHLYKAKNSNSSQEDRRRIFLADQKKKRDGVFSAARGLLQNEEELEDEFEEEMEIVAHKAKIAKKRYAEKLMLSEWMEEVPSDLEQKWLFVPCPTGKRCLLISEKNFSHAYSFRGKHLFKCRPLMKEGRVGRTVLDCVFSRVTHTFYILDVLIWADHPLMDCEAEFRFYWLKSKFEENPNLMEGRGEDEYKFVPLPCAPASAPEIESALTGDQPFSETMDGVLFFHKEVHYTPGTSPLVIWLLPYMVPEVLGVSISDLLLAQQPSDYPGHVEFISKYKKQSGREHRQEVGQRKAATRAALEKLESSMDTTRSDGEYEDGVELG